MHEKFAKQGLVILGVSDESSSLLDKFVEKYEVSYPVVSAPKGGRAYGIKGYPTYVLVGADGKVLSKGRPSEAQIVDALKSVVLFPEIPGKGGKLAALRKACAKADIGSIAKALTRLEADDKLPQEDRDHVQSTRATFDKFCAMAKAEVAGMAGPDYHAQATRLHEISKDFKGLPLAAEAKSKLAAFKKDKAINREMTALRLLSTIRERYDMSKSSSKKKIAKALQRLIAKYPDSFAAKKAKAQLEAQ